MNKRKSFLPLMRLSPSRKGLDEMPLNELAHSREVRCALQGGGRSDPFSSACFELQPLAPRFGSDYLSLTWKDFGQQHALDFFIAVSTAIG